MQTLEQFGQTIKQRYPQYNDIPDAELGKKMLDKYPQYKDIVNPVDTPTQTQNKVPLVAKAAIALTQSEQNFGKDIAQAAYLGLFGGQKQIDKTTQQYLDNGGRLTDLARKQNDPNLKKKYADMAISMFKDAQNVGGSIIGNVRSPEQIVGDALGVGVDVLAAGTYGNASKVAKTGEAVGILKGAKAGAKAGAIVGGIYGAGQGVASGLQENKGVGGVVGRGVTGGILGAGGGAIIGGITGGISGGLKSKALNAKQQQNALNAIIPAPNELSPSEYEEYLQSGKVSPKSKFGTAKINPTDREITYANQYGELLQGKDPVRNINNVLGEISSEDEVVGKYLKDANISYDKEQLRQKLLEKVNPVTDVMVPNEERLTKLKTDLVNGFVDGIQGDNLTDVWKARKSYDKLIETRLNAFSGSPSVKKDLAMAIRNGTQDFIATQSGDVLNSQAVTHDVRDIIGDKMFGLSSKDPELAQKIAGIQLPENIKSPEELKSAILSQLTPEEVKVASKDIERTISTRANFDKEAIKLKFSNTAYVNKYRDSMRRMTDLFNVLDLVENKAVRERGKSAISLWVQKNPYKSKAIGWATGLALTGLGIGYGIGKVKK